MNYWVIFFMLVRKTDDMTNTFLTYHIVLNSSTNSNVPSKKKNCENLRKGRTIYLKFIKFTYYNIYIYGYIYNFFFLFLIHFITH